VAVISRTVVLCASLFVYAQYVYVYIHHFHDTTLYTPYSFAQADVCVCAHERTATAWAEASLTSGKLTAAAPREPFWGSEKINKERSL